MRDVHAVPCGSGVLRRVAVAWPALLLLLAGGCVSVDVARLFDAPLREITLREPEGWTTKRVLVVDVGGFISSDPGGILSAGVRCSPDGVRAVLDRAAEDSRIRAVVLRIDSPGGSVAATDMIYHDLLRFRRETGLPVVASILGTGCSGGYYAACAADTIIVHPAAVTGSIGVILLLPRFEGLTDKLGIEQEVIKSGRLKDMGNPMRGMSDEERRIFADMVDSFHRRFVGVVAEARYHRLDADAVAGLADGRVLSGVAAVEAGLADRVGYPDDAVAAAMEAAGIRDARVITYSRGAGEDATIYSAVAGRPAGGGLRLADTLPPGIAAAGFHYLWLPGR